MTIELDHTILPPADPADQRALTVLAVMFTREGVAELSGPDGEKIRFPDAVASILIQSVEAMRAGRAVTVAPHAQRLTTQEAADLLGVSRPTLVSLLEAGKIPFEQSGRHRRVKLVDLLAYQTRRRTERKAALDDLVRISEDLGLYDDADPLG